VCFSINGKLTTIQLHLLKQQFKNMAPNPNNLMQLLQNAYEDSQSTAPSEVDAQHQGILSTFGCIVGIKNYGTTLETITKCVDANGQFQCFLKTSVPLPENFEAQWCRIFFRHARAMVLVMSFDLQNCIVYDVETGHKEGEWTLFEPFPEFAWLESVQSIDDDSLFSLTYTSDNNEYSVECLYPSAILHAEQLD